MSGPLSLSVNGKLVTVPAGISVAAALACLDLSGTRLDLAGVPRIALCGMGVCFECRVWIDGVERLGCLTPVMRGMEIRTNG